MTKTMKVLFAVFCTCVILSGIADMISANEDIQSYNQQ